MPSEADMSFTPMPIVAFQGEPGAFAEDAVLAFFADPQAVAEPTWRSVFEAVQDGRAAAGVVPVESSMAGTIRETLDLLAEFDLRIVGEVSVPVRLALMAVDGADVADIARVYSHPQALAQADAFLRTRDWQVLTTYNTAGAAKLVAEDGDRAAAAIASPRAAELYGLRVLAADVQGEGANRTRFAVLSTGGLGEGWRRAGLATTPARTTLAFAVRNVPGSLYRCLGVFAERGVNLTRLESRPTRTARWEYVFWVDVDGDPAEAVFGAALADLRERCEMVRVLGTYPRAFDD
jgi:prephenate dehydratase/chorismate mutase/prephenate dehydratase